MSALKCKNLWKKSSDQVDFLFVDVDKHQSFLQRGTIA